MRRAGLLLFGALMMAATASACSSDSKPPTGVASSTTEPSTNQGTALPTTTVPANARVVLAVHDGELDAVATTAPFTQQTVLAAHTINPRGASATGPICIDPVDDRLVGIGVGGAAPGVAILEVHGHGLGDLRATVRVVRATLTDMTVTGCAFLADGRLVVTEHDTHGLGRVTSWPAPLDDPTGPCVLDEQIVSPTGVTTLGSEFVVAAAARTRPLPGLYAYEPAAIGCKLVHLRFAGRLGPDRGPAPGPVTTSGGRVWVAAATGRIVSTAAAAASIIRAEPAIASFSDAQILGLATNSATVVYATTQRSEARSGVMWQVTMTATAARARPMATAWSTPGGVALYVAPNR
jgi:hypothetical protein